MQYGKNGFAVIYDANGGTGAPSEQVKQTGISLQLSKTIPTRTGYTFVGWSEYADNTSYKFLSGDTYSEDRGIKLYAVWISNYQTEIISTITGESLISIVQNSKLKDGFYKFVVNDETYKVHVFVKNENFVYGENGENILFGDNIESDSMMILKCNGDLTISRGATLTPYKKSKGMFIYSSGTIINNGTISMSEKGANTASGQNIYLWKNKVYEDSSKQYEFIPRWGADGGDGVSSSSTSISGKSGKNGESGINRATGGGGSGGVATRGGITNKSNSGGTGTSYSGGVGSNNKDYSGSASGNQNPGGLLIINAETINNTSGSIVSNGATGTRKGSTNSSSGASGGGSINIFCNSFSGRTVIAYGGSRGEGKYSGGAGGDGSVSIGSIASGTYVE